MSATTPLGRLALRVEGEFWNAYWALEQHSMKGAVLLGSIRMTIVEKSQARKHGFMALMQHAFSDMVQDVTGMRPKWNEPQRAPERERSGSA